MSCLGYLHSLDPTLCQARDDDKKTAIQLARLATDAKTDSYKKRKQVLDVLLDEFQLQEDSETAQITVPTGVEMKQLKLNRFYKQQLETIPQIKLSSMCIEKDENKKKKELGRGAFGSVYVAKYSALESIGSIFQKLVSKREEL